MAGNNTSLRLIFLFLTCVVIGTMIFYNVQKSEPSEEEEGILSVEEILEQERVHPQDLLHVDTSNFTNNKIEKWLEESHSNVVPRRLTGSGARFNESCALSVNMIDAEHNNLYWQKQRVGNETYYLLGAYFDNRTTVKYDRIIRIIVMVDKQDRTAELVCQFWYQNETVPIFVNVSEYQQLWKGDVESGENDVHPYLLNCVVPESKSLLPDSVSLVGTPCENPTNNIRVIYSGPPDGMVKDFAVCVSAFGVSKRPFQLLRLVEWIEMNKILGAQKIVFYEMPIHPNMSMVLDYYVKSGFVEVVGISLPGYHANIPEIISSYLNSNKPHIRSFIELVGYNDCLYKNINRFRYTLVLDLFEVVIPRVSLNWRKMIAAEKRKKSPASSFSVVSSVFVDDKAELHDWLAEVPHYMHMLQHVYRNVKLNTSAVRSFQSTNNSLVLGGNVPSWCVEGVDCSNQLLEAQLHKYCVGREEGVCQTERGPQLEIDKFIWRFKDKLVRATNKALQNLGLIEFS